MKTIFLNKDNNIRNGWKILIFFVNFIVLLLLLNSSLSIFLPITDIFIGELIALISVVISTFLMMKFFREEKFWGCWFKVETKHNIWNFLRIDPWLHYDNICRRCELDFVVIKYALVILRWWKGYEISASKSGSNLKSRFVNIPTSLPFESITGIPEIL